MYIFNGKKLTEDQAKKFAEETGRDLQTFLEANPDIREDPDFRPQDELGKPEVAVEKVAPAVTEDTASQLENGSSESSRTSVRSKTRRSDLNKIKPKFIITNNNHIRLNLLNKPNDISAISHVSIMKNKIMIFDMWVLIYMIYSVSI